MITSASSGSGTFQCESRRIRTRLARPDDAVRRSP